MSLYISHRQCVNDPRRHNLESYGTISLLTAAMIATPLDSRRIRERRDASASRMITLATDVSPVQILPSHLLSRSWVQLFEEQRWTSPVLLRYDFICNVQVIDLRNIVCNIDWLDFSRLFFTRRHCARKRERLYVWKREKKRERERWASTVRRY